MLRHHSLLWAAYGLAAWHLAGCASLEESVASKIEYILSAPEAAPGDVVPFSLRLPAEVKTGRVMFLQRSFHLFPRRDVEPPVSTTFLPIPLGTPPGDYVLACGFDLSGSAKPITEDLKFQILPDLRPHPAETFQLRGFSPAAYQQDLLTVQAALRRAGTQPTGRLQPFMLPLGGRIAAGFGTQRTYAPQTRVLLEGVEIEPLGTGAWEVGASAEGRVLLARKLPMLGNTVILDHGCTFASLYSHLQDLAVTAGQFVPRGARLGRVGNTGGAAVGRRLRFQLFVAGVAVNAEKYLDVDLWK